MTRAFKAPARMLVLTEPHALARDSLINRERSGMITSNGRKKRGHELEADLKLSSFNP